MARTAADSGIRRWTPDRLPDLSGRRYLVTGGNTGLGLETAKILAARNADIVIACRNPDKAAAAVADLAGLGPGMAEAVTIDLASLASVRTAAEEIRGRFPDGFDAIVNNAGVMQTPETRTAEGLELQFVSNHLGHFLLNGLLFDLVDRRDGRIVAVSSLAHKRGRIHFGDLMLTRRYGATRAYCQSKLANLMFALELDRRLRAAGSKTGALACHPGFVMTGLQSHANRFWQIGYATAGRLLGQSVAKGGAALALAAAGTEAKSGAYYGPAGLSDGAGPIGDCTVSRAALDRDVAAKLWQESERLAGFSWDGVLAR